METQFSLMRDLSRRLLAASQTASDSHVHEAAVVSEKLRIPLTRFAGAEGFASLLRRALVLALAEEPSLQSLKVGPEGRLEGFEELAAATSTAESGSKAAVAITAHLLSLLSTFIGEPLTLRLIREAWPDTSLDEYIQQNRG
ncbi:MAG: hypothetical protein ACR2H4_04555 [Pyrinomonadaceae bacterium]|jgi:hypothetical protein